MLYTGLATSEEMLVNGPTWCAGSSAPLSRDGEFLKRFKTESLALGKKYDRAPDDVRNADYDATMEMMTADGTEDLDTQKSDIDISRRALAVQKEIPTDQFSIFALPARSTKSCARSAGKKR